MHSRIITALALMVVALAASSLAPALHAQTPEPAPEPAIITQPVAPPTLVDEALTPSDLLVEQRVPPTEVDDPLTRSAAPIAGAAATDAGPTRSAQEIVAGEQAAAIAQAQLEAYVDGVVAAFRERDQINGVVVGIVRDGDVVLLKGYGDARAAPPSAADPQTDLFRIGSISKTFTYVAAMQLIEKGRMRLDDEVNAHLPAELQLPADGYADPIRIRHLMTHSAGFEDLALGHLFVREPDPVLSAADYLIKHRPARVRPPGEQAVYSNYSVALLGAVVANISGELFEDYVERHIFGPLGMPRSTFREPGLSGDPRRLDGPLAGAIAQGFVREGGQYVAKPSEHIAQVAAAGGASTTAADMTRYMRALLGDGSFDGGRVLSPTSNGQLREVMFANVPGINGVAHGFITDRIGPHFTFGHGGATLYFHSTMVLVPDLDLGIFISTNTSTGRRFAAEFPADLVKFLDPAARPGPPQRIALTPGALDRYAGTYMTNRRPWRSADTILIAAEGALTQVRVADDDLVVSSAQNTRRFAPVGENLFREIDGWRTLGFRTASDGSVAELASPSGVSTAARVGWWQLPSTLFVFVFGAGLIALISLIAAARRARKRPRPRPDALFAQLVSAFTALAWLAFIIVAGAAFATYATSGNESMFEYPTRAWRVALALVWVAVAMTAIQVVTVPAVWRSRWFPGAKIGYSLGLLWLIGTIVLLWSWNLVALSGLGF